MLARQGIINDIMAVSDTGTGLQTSSISLPGRRYRIWQVTVNNNDATYWELTQIRLIPGLEGLPNFPTKTVFLKTGYTNGEITLNFKGPIEVTGPCRILSLVWHETSHLHALLAQVERLE